MATVKHDDNQVPALTCVLNTDGVTPIRVKANPTTHAIDAFEGSTGDDYGSDLAARDDNGNPVATATDANGNIIPLYASSDGELLIQST